MSKKKRAARPRVWEYQDEIELLAYLDFTLEHKLDFKRTVSSHLSTVTGKQFSEKQVFGKLEREWSEWGRLGDKTGSVQDLLSEGSSFLEGYTESDHQEILQAFRRLQPPAHRYRLRSTPRTTVATSRTLSRSATRQTLTRRPYPSAPRRISTTLDIFKGLREESKRPHARYVVFLGPGSGLSRPCYG